MSTTASTPAVNTPEVTLPSTEIVRAATNSPALAENEFEFAGRKFKVVDLEYDYYMEFLSKIEPLINAVVGKLAGKANLGVPGIALTADSGFSVASLMSFCKKDLPDMVRIICNMQTIAETPAGQHVDPSKLVTTEYVKKNAKTPWQLAQIVMLQVSQNNIISDFASFFVQVLPLMGAVQNLTSLKTQPTA